MDDNLKARWGRDLPGRLADIWPRETDGKFEEPAFLIHCASTDMADELMVNMLDAFGIPCLRQYPNDGCFGKVVLGMSGMGADLYVPKSMLPEAKALCEGVPDDENV